MTATYPTKIVLAFRSGGVCAFPKCGRHLTYEAINGDDASVGEAAHIRGEKPNAARYDPSMSDQERDAIDNLIYMCPGDHTIIDKVEADWPVDKLINLKKNHEETVKIAMEQAFADVAFPELERVIAWVTEEAPAVPVGGFDIIPPDAKIKKNELSNGSRNIIIAGLTARPTVAGFVESQTQLDADFPEKLKAGFLAQYYKFRSQGIKGDVLFEMMCSFSQRGAKSNADRAGGLAVLVYLFEICDVFEK